MNEVPAPGFTNHSITEKKIHRTALGSGYVRYFFVVMAIMFFLIVIAGFIPDYQMIMHGQMKLHWFAHFHGAVMTIWLGIFLIQSILAAKGNLKFHRQLGLFSVWYGAFVWLIMGITTFRAHIALNPPMADDFQFDILFEQLYSLTLFGLFFTWGMRVRKNAAAHKRLLLLATLVLLQAAIDRMAFLPGIYSATYVRFLYSDALLIPLLIYDWVNLGRIHKITMLGALLIGLLQVGIVLSWGSPAWHRFWFNSISPFVEKVVEVKLTDAQADLLVGDYEGNPVGKMTVTRNNGRLYLQLDGQEKQEMGAKSGTELFVKTLNVKLSFVKGVDGRVTKAIFHQGPQVVEMIKLKHP